MWIFILTFSLKSPNKKRNKKHSFNDNLNYLKIWRKKNLSIKREPLHSNREQICMPFFKKKLKTKQNKIFLTLNQGHTEL